MNVQLRDTRQRILDQDRDLDALRSRHQAQVARNLTADLRQSVELHDLTVFPSRGLPDSLVLKGGADHGVVYPVLVDRGNSVDMLVRSTPRGRAALNRDGYIRLALLAEPRTARELRREAEHDGTLMMHFASLGSPAAFAGDLVAAAFWFACFDGSELPRTRSGFDARVSTGAAMVHETFSEIIAHARHTLAKRTAVAHRIEELASPAFVKSREDMAHQLEHLVGSDFLRTTPRGRLPDLSRYLDGMAHRIENLRGRVERDLAGVERVAAWERRLAAAEEQAEDAQSGTVEELRFLIEEFRIATFAQRVGTRGKISEKRLARRFEAALPSLPTP